MKPQDVNILLVDDERDILEILSYNLAKEGYLITTVQSGEEALDKVRKKTPDLIILDLMMPGINGIETCKRLRKMSKLKHTIIAFLTARNDDFTEMRGYDAGADDYITKPVRPKVLVSKVGALLRRLNHVSIFDEEVINAGDLHIDLKEYQVTYADEKIHLPRKEFELLALLASVPGKVFNRDEILEQVWGEDVVVGNRTVDVHIRKLRKKIGEDRIETLKGVGYKFIA